ncbi:MAG: TauD/TfdA family dioxygenase [Cyanobacteriota bacterium]
MKNIKILEFNNDLVFLAKEIKNIIENDACLIKNFKNSINDKEFSELAHLLGSPLKEERNIDNDIIYRVEINKNLDTPTYANTEYEFWCHTDCAEMNYPPDVVMLYCEKPSSQGGESYLIKFDDIKNFFSDMELFYLTQKAFPFKDQFYSILEIDEKDNFLFRYNRLTIDFSLDLLEIEIEKRYIDLIGKLDSVMNENKFSFKLEKNECFIFNNK